MTDQDGHEPGQTPAAGNSAEELRWLWIRMGVRLGIVLLVIAATLFLIFSAD